MPIDLVSNQSKTLTAMERINLFNEDTAESMSDPEPDIPELPKDGPSLAQVSPDNLEVSAMLPIDYTTEVPLQDVVVLMTEPGKSVLDYVQELNATMKLPPELKLYHRARITRLVLLLTVEQVVAEIYHPNREFYILLTRDFKVDRRKGNYLPHQRHPTRSQRAAILRKEIMDFYQFHRMVFFYMSTLDVDRDIINYIIRDQTSLHMCRLAGRMPRLRWQYNGLVNVWPCDFVIITWAEELYEKRSFSMEQVNFHSLMISVVSFIRDTCDMDCSLAVDHVTRRIVALGIELEKEGNGEVVHSPMVMMEAMARYRGYGEWKEDWDRVEAPEAPAADAEDYEDPSLLLDGVDLSWREYIRRFFDVEFGADPCVDPFEYKTMCKGFDFYMSREPCMDCAQFMISRHTQSVFFQYENGDDVCRELLHLNPFDPDRPSFVGYHVTQKVTQRSDD